MLELDTLLELAVDRGYVSLDDYLSSIEIGNEIGSGDGEARLIRYDVE